MRVLLLAPGATSRVPVLTCADELRRGAEVEVLDASSDAEVDQALDGLSGNDSRLVVAGGDGPLRAVVRRLVRRAMPPPSKRPDDLAADRTIHDLPPVGVLPVDVADPAPSLVDRLGLPKAPAEVAGAVLGGRTRRLDLLRNDGGSVTLHGVMLGGADDRGVPVPWQARVDVDDAMLSDGSEPLLACAVANADGYGDVDGLPLIKEADPADGAVSVGIMLVSDDVFEVRRAHGRAVSVSVVDGSDGGVPFTDDGVEGALSRKRTWWTERAAWAVYVP